MDYCAELQTYQYKIEDISDTIKLLKKLAKHNANPVSNIDELIKELNNQKMLATKQYDKAYAEYCDEAASLAKVLY